MTNSIDRNQVASWLGQVGGEKPERILQWSVEQFGGKVVFASSMGAEDQVLTHMIAENGLDTPVFTLDTGRLFQETYELIAQTQRRYGIDIKVYFPDAQSVEEMVNEHGVDLYRESVDLRKTCCGVRKLEPLKRALSGNSAWICGLRQSQSAARAGVHEIEWDEAHAMAKVNPLARWTEEQVWAYIEEHNVPYNVLHKQGFPSIGCACCTRAVAEGEGIREGRWWWESEEHKECGLHRRR